MSSMKRRVSAGVLSVVALSLASCDNAPNPNFEKAVKDRQAARTGDPYVQLNYTPRQYRYVRAEPGLREGQVSQDSLSFKSYYTSMLEKLDAAPKVAELETLTAACRKSFAAATAFQGNDTLAAADAETEGKAVFEQLRACRDGALRAGEAATEDAVRERAATLRRFASSGMILVGASTVAHGGETAGLAMWKEGDALAAKDKPGFKLTADSFRTQ